MPVSINNTQVVFNNGTTQTTAPVNTSANVNSVSAGTGISVNATTGALTVSNTGVTSVNGQTGAVSVTSNPGTVTAVATSNGLQGGTITSTGTLSVACPGYNTVGSYCTAILIDATAIGGGNYGSSGGAGTIYAYANEVGDQNNYRYGEGGNVSGTWKWMSGNGNASTRWAGIACRVA